MLNWSLQGNVHVKHRHCGCGEFATYERTKKNSYGNSLSKIKANERMHLKMEDKFFLRN